MKVQVCEHCIGEEMERILTELKAVEQKLKEKSITLEIEKTGCLGTCMGPVISVDGRIHREVQALRIPEIIMEALD
jgi:NADH:ubiquinone oxidoreductase subunit E